jgi:hypothetical protein
MTVFHPHSFHLYKIDDSLPSPPRVSFDGVTTLDDVTDGIDVRGRADGSDGQKRPGGSELACKEVSTVAVVDWSDLQASLFRASQQ